MSKIKGITLHRPWSAAVAYFGKDFENRTWATGIVGLARGCAATGED